MRSYTQVLKSVLESSDPIWNETVELKSSAELSVCYKVEITVWSKDAFGSDDFLGSVSVSLDKLNLCKPDDPIVSDSTSNNVLAGSSLFEEDVYCPPTSTIFWVPLAFVTTKLQQGGDTGFLKVGFQLCLDEENAQARKEYLTGVRPMPSLRDVQDIEGAEDISPHARAANEILYSSIGSRASRSSFGIGRNSVTSPEPNADKFDIGHSREASMNSVDSIGGVVVTKLRRIMRTLSTATTSSTLMRRGSSNNTEVLESVKEQLDNLETDLLHSFSSSSTMKRKSMRGSVTLIDETGESLLRHQYSREAQLKFCFRVASSPTAPLQDQTALRRKTRMRSSTWTIWATHKDHLVGKIFKTGMMGDT